MPLYPSGTLVEGIDAETGASQNGIILSNDHRKKTTRVRLLTFLPEYADLRTKSVMWTTRDALGSRRHVGVRQAMLSIWHEGIVIKKGTGVRLVDEGKDDMPLAIVLGTVNHGRTILIKGKHPNTPPSWEIEYIDVIPDEWLPAEDQRWLAFEREALTL